MPSFYVYVPNKALRDALIEQIKQSDDMDVIEIADINMAPTQSDSVLIIDEQTLDKKTLKYLREARKVEMRSTILLLGEVSALESDLFTESFAKPLRLGHFMVRLHFYIEIAPRLRSTQLIFGPYNLETQNRQIVVISNNDIIRLTEKETALLEYLGQSDQPIGREELLAAIWGYNPSIETHTLETHIYQLRRKLDPDNKGDNWLINKQGTYSLSRTGVE